MQVNKFREKEAVGIDDLPDAYLERIRRILGDEADAFISSTVDEERTYGLRLNPLKCDSSLASDILNRIGPEGLEATRIPWTKEGYYYNKDSCPGRSPYHESGLYYIQEPSAMAVAEALDVRPGDRVCDLCAAPGGKSTHIAGKMHGEGLIVSNEIIPDRARILSRNIERMGVRNAVVTNEDPVRLAEFFTGYFDKMCVDAPCSGEGMFRKEPASVKEWSPENVDMCAERQLSILECAEQMTAPGGRLVYSTCTFEPKENEEVISAFLKKHPDWRLADTGLSGYFSGGLPGFGLDEDEIMLVSRAWPHRCKGEGHFIACLQKEGETVRNKNALYEDLGTKNRKSYAELEGFLHSELRLNEESDIYRSLLSGRIHEYKNSCYTIPPGFNQQLLKKLNVIRCGIRLGEWDGKRYRPDHALAMCLAKGEIKNTCNITLNEAGAFLRGETLNLSDQGDSREKGWAVVTLDDLPLGWGKIVGNTLKNHYPKGLRKF